MEEEEEGDDDDSGASGWETASDDEEDDVLGPLPHGQPPPPEGADTAEDWEEWDIRRSLFDNHISKCVEARACCGGGLARARRGEGGTKSGGRVHVHACACAPKHSKCEPQVECGGGLSSDSCSDS